MVISLSIKPVDCTMIPMNTNAIPANVTSEETAFLIPSHSSSGALVPPTSATPTRPISSASAILRFSKTLNTTVIAMNTINATMPMFTPFNSN